MWEENLCYGRTQSGTAAFSSLSASTCFAPIIRNQKTTKPQLHLTRFMNAARWLDERHRGAAAESARAGLRVARR